MIVRLAFGRAEILGGGGTIGARYKASERDNDTSNRLCIRFAMGLHLMHGGDEKHYSAPIRALRIDWHLVRLPLGDVTSSRSASSFIA